MEETMPPILNGVFTALVTPFKGPNQDFAIDYDAFRALCKRQLSSGVQGLVPCGTTGETPTLTSEEWRRIITITVEEANGQVPVIAGCGTNNTRTTIENVKQAKELGADAALVVFPYYNKPNRAGHLAHVHAVCDVGLPVVLYHVPGRTGQRLSAELLEELCKIDGVIGLKEATGDVTLGLELCNRLSNTNVALLSGDDFTFATLITHGFHGVISVLSNPAPAQTVAWAVAASNGSSEDLSKYRTNLLPLVDFLFHQSNPLPCKALMNHMRLLESHARLPLVGLHHDEYSLPNGWEGLQ
jgi:4-hydroxy-tetrahydrodipicolinate synthase